ncbi:LytR C-terminal domain-containing protein [Corynebacterium aquatimens]|uniref:LytR C-terminal domain-containing protein n=1 Tax=Corynebacterium TaxID=1716 RepID=UPI001F15E8DB|nr:MULTISPECIES: LytR C-terminal domain-containing protein [Corynebacterium]QYH19183.1 LytR C-terminal domain-containing protein [Corynebacterium aquatimens]UIZ91931.1 LytR C-terminal domain-containing protein [Corynebacterium sp. CNCTC7651]
MTSKYTGNHGNGDNRDPRDYSADDYEYTEAYPVDEYPQDEGVEYGDDGYADDGYDEAEYVEYEVVDEEPVEDYRGAHRRDEEDFDDAYLAAPAAGTAATAGAGSTAVVAGGVPKRGLAMILIAVAALLLLWGIYAMTQNKNPDNSAAPAGTATTTAAATNTVTEDASASANPNDPNAPANSADPNAPANPADANNPADPNNPNAPADANNADANANPAAPAVPAGAALTAANAQVFVYNNSGIPNAAGDTANRLDSQYTIANNSNNPGAMNMPEQQYGIFPQTLVFYNPQTPGAEQLAAEIAQKVGGTPRATNDLPQGATALPEQVVKNPNAIAVVIAG